MISGWELSILEMLLCIYCVCANFYLNAHGLGNSNFFIIFSILWLVGWWKSLESLYVWRGLLFGFEGGGGTFPLPIIWTDHHQQQPVAVSFVLFFLTLGWLSEKTVHLRSFKWLLYLIPAQPSLKKSTTVRRRQRNISHLSLMTGNIKSDSNKWNPLKVSILVPM